MVEERAARQKTYRTTTFVCLRRHGCAVNEMSVFAMTMDMAAFKEVFENASVRLISRG